ncbi:MAG: RNA ligase family protein [Candidatus Paceibacterota bacterium]
MEEILLDRDTFRESVFKRDGFKCIICHEQAQDAHHIVERRLFGTTQGYFINNGASLCSKHHIQAEETTLSCEEIRKAAGITKIIMPDHFYQDAEYDKWGNEIQKNGTRLKGELFEDESVQKILKQGNVLGLFTDMVKYPRTYHLPWSEGMNRDDRMMTNVEVFEEEEVIIGEKLDGENTTFGKTYTHARSLDSGSHPSRNWVKSLWAQVGYEIPEGWRVCGENMYAKHAIHYRKEKGNALSTYFYMFSIWNEKNICLSWHETEEWAQLLGLTLMPVLYKGIWDMKVIENLNKKVKATSDTMEGYVVRLAREFHYAEFRNVCGKFVRKNHVQNNHGHWSTNKIIKNELIEKV